MAISEKDRAAIAELAKGGWYTTLAIAKIIGCSESTVKAYSNGYKPGWALEDLRKKRAIEMIEANANPVRVANHFNVSMKTLRSWVGAFPKQVGDQDGHVKIRAEMLKLLRNHYPTEQIGHALLGVSRQRVLQMIKQGEEE